MWLEDFEQVVFVQSLGGAHMQEVDKVVWHCTAGWCAEHAFNVYYGAPSGACPNITAEYIGTNGSDTIRNITRRKFQHVPLSSSSYALQRGDRNHVCNVQTNRAGVIQIERVGFPDDNVSNDEHKWLGEAVLAPILRNCPKIPPIVYQGGARMTEAEWSRFAGSCGHRHVCCQPDNHGDPPELDLDLIHHYALEYNLELAQPKGPIDMIRLIVTDDPAGAQLTLGVGTLAWISTDPLPRIFAEAHTPTVSVTVAEVKKLLESHIGIGVAPTWGALQGAW